MTAWWWWFVAPPAALYLLVGIHAVRSWVAMRRQLRDWQRYG